MRRSGAGREIYYYDENGQRYLSVEFSSKGTVLRSRTWFGNSEFWNHGDGDSEKAMTHLSLGSIGIARIDNESGQQELEYSFHNGLGHLMASTSETGELTTAFTYGPFGEVVEQGGDVDDHLRRFNGKEADQVSRLNYYGYRYYDPLSLTWTQADPLFRVAPDIAYDQPRAMSLYAFSLNNPVRYADPDGRCAGSICAVDETIIGSEVNGKPVAATPGEAASSGGIVEGGLAGAKIPIAGVINIGEGLGEAAAMANQGNMIAAGDRMGEVASDVAWEAGPGAVVGLGGKLFSRALKVSDETVDLFRAVGKTELENIQKSGKFSMGPGGEMKQFGLSASEATTFGTKMNGMMSGNGYSAIVKATIPKTVAAGLDATSVDAHIFRAGVLTATTKTLGFVNDNLIGPISNIISL